MTPSYEIVVVGTSLGGFQALKAVLGALGEDFPLPIAVVQHLGEGAMGDLAWLLGRYTSLPVEEPEDKQPIRSGTVYVSPAGYHLMVEERGRFALSTDAPVLYARPSIDVLFETASEAYGAGVVGVALTAASADGAEGLAAIKARGGYAIVQEPTTAESPILPNAALKALGKRGPDSLLPLVEIGAFLATLCKQRPSSVSRGARRSVPSPT